jgi:hypothetical protein
MDNGRVSLALTVGGGHIAALAHRDRPKLNPLWAPIWKTMEPWQYRSTDARHCGIRLLAAICGHNLCLGWFGTPSPEEQKAGMGVHGEAPVARWKFTQKTLGKERMSLTCGCDLPAARMRFSRTISSRRDSDVIHITESVLSLAACDMPFTICEHVTFGPPFLEKGVTVFDMPATQCRTFPGKFEDPQRLMPDTPFQWPQGPGADGRAVDMRMIRTEDAVSGDFSAQLMNPAREDAWFSALHPQKRLLVAYMWKRRDFPWVGNWEENYSRKAKPWAGKSLARGMEFTNTPFPTGLRAAVDLHTFQGQPTYRWLPAKGRVDLEYDLTVRPVDEGCRGVSDIRSRNGDFEIDYL